MKRFFSIILIALMMSILVACGDNQDKDGIVQSTESQSEDGGVENNTQEEEKAEICWISGSTVNFRKTPSTDGEIIAELTKGTEVLKTAQEGDWVSICYGEINGYIHKDYVSKYPPVNLENGEVSIVVKKLERVLELWQAGEVLISFPIGLGWAPEGHKQVEGDGKTPEGEYYVCVKNYNSAFYLSLGVSYPNKTDAAAALQDGRIDRETYERIASAIDSGQCPDWYTPLGGAIMIHGYGSASDWTFGCIAVDNDVMDYLFACCSKGTRITILP